MSQLLTVREAAAQLRLHPETLYRWNAEGKGPTFVRLGTAFAATGAIRARAAAAQTAPRVEPLVPVSASLDR